MNCGNREAHARWNVGGHTSLEITKMFLEHFDKMHAACFSWGALAVLGMEMTTTHVLGSLQKTSKDSCTPIKVKCRTKTHDTISCSPRQTHSNQIIVIDNYIRVAMASHLRCVKRRKLSAKHRRHCSFYNGRLSITASALPTVARNGPDPSAFHPEMTKWTEEQAWGSSVSLRISFETHCTTRCTKQMRKGMKRKCY